DGKSSPITTQITTQIILEILRKNPHASREEIAQTLGDITADGVKYQLNKMKREKIIQRIGPSKGGYWDVIRQKE
ncbi:MAG: winged helix-turn-helix transcriptional regulator, partial [Lentisphaerota bacterium]